MDEEEFVKNIEKATEDGEEKIIIQITNSLAKQADDNYIGE